MEENGSFYRYNFNVKWRIIYRYGCHKKGWGFRQYSFYICWPMGLGERIIRKEDRNEEYLKDIVRKNI